MNRPGSSQSGFTLLEVTIGAALLGIMMLLLTGSLRVGAESWDAGEEKMAKASRMFVAQNFLRAHVGSLLPVAATRKDGELEPPVMGGPDSLEYVAPLPDQIKAGGLFRFRLYLDKKGEHQDLRVTITPYRTGPQQQQGLGQNEKVEPLDDLPLVEDVAKFQASYLPSTAMVPGAIGSGDDVKWVEEWNRPQLPALIKLEIEPEGEGPWPVLVIAPKTQMLR